MEQLLKPAAVAEMLHVTTETLRRWRDEGTGPPFKRLTARTVRYARSDVEEWLPHDDGPPGASEGEA